MTLRLACGSTICSRGEHEVSQNGSFLTDVAGPRYYSWPTGPGSVIGAPELFHSALRVRHRRLGGGTLPVPALLYISGAPDDDLQNSMRICKTARNFRDLARS
jgi:hypothetical protein